MFTMSCFCSIFINKIWSLLHESHSSSKCSQSSTTHLPWDPNNNNNNTHTQRIIMAFHQQLTCCFMVPSQQQAAASCYTRNLHSTCHWHFGINIWSALVKYGNGPGFHSSPDRSATPQSTHCLVTIRQIPAASRANVDSGTWSSQSRDLRCKLSCDCLPLWWYLGSVHWVIYCFSRLVRGTLRK